MTRIETLVAFRHIRSGQRQTIFSILAVALTVAIISISMGMLNGITGELISNTVENQAHVLVEPKEDEEYIHLYRGLTGRIEDIRGVVAVSPRLNVEVALEHEDEARGAALVGVDAEREDMVMQVEEDMTQGRFTAVDRVGPGLVLGDDLADELGVGVGDTVSASSPAAGTTRFKVVGILDTGTPRDGTLAYTSLGTAQDIIGVGAASEIAVRVEDINEASRVSGDIRGRTDYQAKSWIEQNAAIFELINTQMSTVWVFYALIFAVSGFGVANTLVMVVMEKTREIGMLMAMGTTPRQITMIFLVESGLLGLIGVVLGVILGYLGSVALATYEISLPSEVYFGLTHMPIAISPENFLAAGVFAIAVNLIAGVYPARRAARLDPVEAIKRD